jgi:tRNA dimethylallyltransferase
VNAHDPRPRPVALVGPTASGKSSIGLEVARRRGDVEIVSVDAMQVYRGMDIGTAKPSVAEQAEVRHHLIDVADPSDDYALARFQRDALAALDDIARRNKRALLVGGTGLYLRAVVDRLEIPGQFPETRDELESEPDTTALHERLRALDPLAAARMEPTNRRRIIRALEVTVGGGRPFSSYGPGLTAYGATDVAIVGLQVPRPELDARIDRRYDEQLAAGFLDEVRALARRPLSRTAGQALGYRELLEHVRGTTSLAEALDTARRRTRRFARRQERWFRRDPRIRWVDPGEKGESGIAALLEELDR